MRTGLDSVKAVVTTLVQAEKYGTPLGQRSACWPRRTATCA